VLPLEPILALLASPTPTHTRLLRWIGGLLAALLLLAGGAYALLHILVDADTVSTRLTDVLADATDSLYAAEVERVRFRLFPATLVAEGLTLKPRDARLRALEAAGRLPGYWAEVHLPALRLHGVDAWTLLRRQALAFGTVDVEQPRVRLTARPAPADEDDDAPSGATPRRDVHAALARSLPALSMAQLSLDDGTLILAQHGPDAPPPDTLAGLAVILRDVRVDSAAARDTTRFLFSDDVAVRLEGFTQYACDGTHAVHVGPVAASSRAGTVSIDAVRLAPTSKSSGPAGACNRDRIDIGARGLHLRQLSFRRLLERGELVAAMLRIDTLTVDVYSNKQLPPTGPPAQPVLPNEAFRNLGLALGVDTLYVAAGDIRYAELAPDGARPGRLHFASVKAQMRGVANRPGLLAHDGPAVIDVEALLAGQGLLRAEITYALLAPTLTMRYRGGLGRMDASGFNDILVDLEGIRLTSGRVEAVDFDVHVRNGLAAGHLVARYHDLSIDVMDKATRSENVLQQLEAFVANSVVLRTQNPPEGEETPYVAQIEYQKQPTDPFFGFLWFSLRQGLLGTLGM
jgi:hypothetical protein